MRLLSFICPHCRKGTQKAAGHVRRSQSIGAPVYCSIKCAGLARRKPKKPKAQRVAEKRIYDAAYRKKNLAVIKARKSEYFRRTYDPAAAAIARKKRTPRHVEYCRQPKYRKWKSEYDRQHRAKEYGAFAEAFRLTIDLNREIKSRSSSYEIRQENKTACKAQKRAREAGERPRDRRDRHSAPYGQ